MTYDRNTHLLDWLTDGYTHCKHGTKEWCEAYLHNARDAILDQDETIASTQADILRLKAALEEERGRNRKLHRRAQMAEALTQSIEALFKGWVNVVKERKGGDLSLIRFGVALNEIDNARTRIAARSLSQDGEGGA